MRRFLLSVCLLLIVALVWLWPVQYAEGEAENGPPAETADGGQRVSPPPQEKAEVIYTDHYMPEDNGIPLVIITTVHNQRITNKIDNIPARMKIVDSRSKPYGRGLFEGEIEIRGRGNTSFWMPKSSYNFSIETKSPILDMTPSDAWMLIANYADKSLMRNYTAYEFSRDLGARFAPKLRFVDFILDGDYLGTYAIGERVKIDPGRLDLPKLRPHMQREYELTGSYVLEVNAQDKRNPDEIIFETSKVRRNTFFSIKQPGAHNLSPEAFEYIKDYVNRAEDALFSPHFKDPEIGYRAYLDVPSFIDWYLVNELYKNVDARFYTSVYLFKPRGEKLHMGPVWDFDIGAGNVYYLNCDDPEGWHVIDSAWMRRLFEDEAFAQEFKDRWNYIKDNGYFDVFFQRIDDTARLLEKSQRMNFRRWPILGVYVWPNAPGVEQRTTYRCEVDYLKNWLMRRSRWMDREINK
jgi:hypothetical protein